MIKAIIKVGGSILEKGTPEQIQALTRVIQILGEEQQDFVVVPGGGIFAENIRISQRKLQFDDETAHWLAILGMDQQAILLEYYIQKAEVTQFTKHNQKELENILLEKKVPILLTWNHMRNESNLPHSWHVTSDAIAAEVATALETKMIVFVKDVDGVLVNGKIVPKISWEQLQQQPSSPLDSQTPAILSQSEIRTFIVNGFHPERLRQVLKNESLQIGTEIID